jgi:YD repeat-containing protein
MTKAVDLLGYETSIEYNKLGKPTRITKPNGGKVNLSYDD